MVVAAGAAELFVRRADALAERMRLAEIERRAGDVHQLAGRDQRRADRHDLVGAQGEAVVEDGASAGEVEEHVIRQVAGRGGVGRRREVDGQLVGMVGEDVGDRDAERAGIALLARGAHVGETYAGRVGGAERRRGPDALVEAAEAAVEVVAVVVAGQLDRPPVEGQASVGEPVGVAADRAAEERVAGGVVGERAQAERDLVDPAMEVGHADRGERRAVVADRDFHAAGVGEGVELDRAALQFAMEAAQGKPGAARAQEDQEHGDEEGAVGQRFRGGHGRKLSDGGGLGKSKRGGRGGCPRGLNGGLR